MRNKFPGTCYRCGLPVAAGAGHFERSGGGWRTQHADCAIRWRGEAAPSREDARAAHLKACPPAKEASGA
jgi:hypothetical protein